MKNYFNQTSRNPIKTTFSHFDQSVASVRHHQTPTNQANMIKISSDVATKKSRNDGNGPSSITQSKEIKMQKMI